MEENSIKNQDRLDIEADLENLPVVTDFVEQRVRKLNSSQKEVSQTLIVTEELFVNIASYAYGQDTGMATLIVEISRDDNSIEITFIDSGVRYNPLDKDDPDITLEARERQKGGLGIFFVKKKVDSMTYRYEERKNILTIKKTFRGE